jgi:hypothetical protein
VQVGPEFLPVHGLGGVAGMPRDLLDRHALSDSSETPSATGPEGPVPAEPDPLATSWNIFRTCLAPSGVQVTVASTLPVPCQPEPAASRSAA